MDNRVKKPVKAIQSRNSEIFLRTFLNYLRLTGLSDLVLVEDSGALKIENGPKVWRIHQYLISISVILAGITYICFAYRDPDFSMTKIMQSMDSVIYTLTVAAIYCSINPKSQQLKSIFNRMMLHSKCLQDNQWRAFYQLIMLEFAVNGAYLVYYSLEVFSDFRYTAEAPATLFLCTWTLILIGAFSALYGNILIINYFILREINDTLRLMTELPRTSVNDLKQLLITHKEVWDVVEDINDICGVGNVVCSAANTWEYLFITSEIIRTGYVVLGDVACSILVTFRMLLCLIAAENITHEGLKTAWLSSLTTVPHPSYEESVKDFSLHKNHIDHQLDASGFFKMNLAFFGTVIGTTVTYAVILLQFPSEDALVSSRGTSSPFEA